MRALPCRSRRNGAWVPLLLCAGQRRKEGSIRVRLRRNVIFQASRHTLERPKGLRERRRSLGADRFDRARRLLPLPSQIRPGSNCR